VDAAEVDWSFTAKQNIDGRTGAANVVYFLLSLGLSQLSSDHGLSIKRWIAKNMLLIF
jgi:hypothetical protein